MIFYHFCATLYPEGLKYSVGIFFRKIPQKSFSRGRFKFNFERTPPKYLGGASVYKMEEQKNKLYVGNLPYSVDGEGLKTLFAEAGEVTEAIVISDKFSGRSKGFGFVTMKDDAAAEKAIKDMDGKEVEGRALKVNIARPMRPRE